MSSIHIFSTWASAWILYIIQWSKQYIPHLKRLLWSSLSRPFSSSFSLGRLISSSFSYWYSLMLMLTHYHYHWAGFSIYILIMEASCVLIVTLDSCQLFLSLVSWKNKTPSTPVSPSSDCSAFVYSWTLSNPYTQFGPVYFRDPQSIYFSPYGTPDSLWPKLTCVLMSIIKIAASISLRTRDPCN